MWKIFTKIEMYIKTFLIAFTLLFSACSIKNYEHTQSKIIIIKTPKIKFADLGYLRNTQNAIELELFVAGKSIEKFTINHLVCVNAGCMSKSGFNADYLNAAYPDDLLQNIFLGKKIYEGKGSLKTQDGFTQKIKTKSVDIKYRVNTKEIFFKDRQNRIIFKIKDVK